MDILKLENAYLDLYWLKQRYQWENYAEGKNWDLNDVDSKIFHIFLSHQLNDKRNSEYFDRRVEMLDRIKSRALVDLDPEICSLRNYLDNLDNFSEAQTKFKIAQLMKPHVLKLMQLRNERSQFYKYESYAHLVFTCEELRLEDAVESCEAYVKKYLNQAKSIIYENQISWSSWVSDLNKLSEIGFDWDYKKYLNDVFVRFDFIDCENRIRCVAKEQPIFGYTSILESHCDIRILFSYAPSLAALSIFFHELGHAIAHACDQSKGIYNIWSSHMDESYAILLQRCFEYCLLSEDSKIVIDKIKILEGVRCAISFLYEVELNKAPHLAEELYLKFYGQLIEIDEPGIWSYDSFRSLDPFYIHNYCLGEICAESEIKSLVNDFGLDFTLWGHYLRNYFSYGNSISNFSLKTCKI